MDTKSRIKSLISQAELYRSHGLFSESKEKYESASDIIRKIEKLKNKDALLNSIQLKIDKLNQMETRIRMKKSSPELSNRAQNLIKDLFSFSGKDDPDADTIEGALALAKFGQFDRALSEFEALLKKKSMRVTAAKNILRCKMAALSPDHAIVQYNEWHGGKLFSVEQLDAVRKYLKTILEKKGIRENLPLPVATGEEDETVIADFSPEVKEPEEEFLDITSIGITFDSGPQKGKMVEFDVNFQSGSTLSLIISKKDKALIEEMNTGIRLNEVQFYSPIAIFKGTGMVAARTEIKSGPKKGDFCLDVKMLSS